MADIFATHDLLKAEVDFDTWDIDLGSVAGAALSFVAFLDDVRNGVAKTYQEAGAAYDSWAEAVDAYVAIVDTLEDMTADAIGYAADTVDACYQSLAEARDLVDAIGTEVADTWRNVEQPAERTVDSVLEEFLGGATDDALSALLSANPSMIDMMIVPAGFALRIPVIA